MFLSIIVTCYNYEKYVGEAIESVLPQLSDTVELIVVDDGSTDNSKSVIEAYLEEVNFRLISKDNGGQASAFNAGFKAARGRWVIFLDADDLLLSERLDGVQLPDPEVYSKVHSRMEKIDTNGNHIGWEPRLRYKLSEGDCFDLVLRNKFVTVPTSGNIFSAAFLGRVLPIPEEAYRISADDYLNILAPFEGKIKAESLVFSQYRIHGGNNYAVSGGGKRKPATVRFKALEQRAKVLSEVSERFGMDYDRFRLLTFRGMAIIWVSGYCVDRMSWSSPYSGVKFSDLFKEAMRQCRNHFGHGLWFLSQLAVLVILVAFCGRKKTVNEIFKNRLIAL